MKKYLLLVLLVSLSIKGVGCWGKNQYYGDVFVYWGNPFWSRDCDEGINFSHGAFMYDHLWAGLCQVYQPGQWYWSYDSTKVDEDGANSYMPEFWTDR